LQHQPAFTERVHLSYDKVDIAAFAALVKDIPPGER
tara:strand:+ start:3171 stop:3278 length:108 start_codon:yes stop_codon:yes gene_type:complete